MKSRLMKPVHAAAILVALSWTARAPAADSAPPDERTQLPDIIVTGQKVAKLLEDVPVSVSSLRGDMIEDSGLTGFNEVQDYTANVSIRVSSGAGQYSIRGFGTADTNQAFDPSVGTLIDGVYYGRSNFLPVFTSDIDRFEVLRGPQGTLFGKNNTAGVFNLVMQSPVSRFLTHWDLLASNNGDRSFRPVINVPLGGHLALRLSGNYENGDRGTLVNTDLKRGERNVEQGTTRARLRYLPDRDLVVDIGAFYSHQTQNFNQFQFSRLTPSMQALVQHYDPNADAVVDLRNSSNYPSQENTVLRGISAIEDGNLGAIWGAKEVRIKAITGYADSTSYKFDLDADFSPVPFITDTLAEPRRYKQFSQELHVSGEVPSLLGWGKGVSFVFGGYFFQSSFRTSDLFNIEDLGAAFAYEVAAQSGSNVPACLIPPPPSDPAAGPTPCLLTPGALGTIGGTLAQPLQTVLDLLNPVTGQANLGTAQNAAVKLNQHARDYAIFGQAEHKFAEDWALIGGLRFDVESKSGVASSKANGALIPLIAQQRDHNTSISRIEHQLSPKVGIKWTGIKRTEVYATWTRGFKSGGFNALPLTPDNLEFEPETATSIELGGKARTAGGTLRMSAAIFTTTFDNLQVSTFTNNSFVVLNAARARSRGFEADLHWLTPLPGLSLYTSAGLADARYLSYPCAPAPSDSSSQGPTCPAPQGNPLSPGLPTQDLAGKPLSFAPRWTAALIPAYDLRLPHYLSAVFAVDVLYRGQQSLNPDNDPRKQQPATTQFNAHFTLGDLSKTWKLTFVGHNLTDKVILDQAADQPLAPGNISVVRSDRGRFYSASLAVTF